MKQAYYCNTCTELFEAGGTANESAPCPRASGSQAHDVEYAGPLYFDLDNLDTGPEPPLEVDGPAWVAPPGPVSTAKVTPPAPVATTGLMQNTPIVPEKAEEPALAPKKPSFAQLAAKVPQPKVVTPSVVPATSPRPKLQEIPVAAHAPTTLSGTQKDDYESIMKVVFAERGAVTTIQWTSATGSGPSVSVSTKLKRNEVSAQALHGAVRNALHGKRIPGTKGLTFYVTQMGGAGARGVGQMKAGFRITSHKKNSHEALAVLHIQND